MTQVRQQEHGADSPGGRQPSRVVGDPFLSTRACSDYTGYSTQYFRLAIKAHELESEYVKKPGRSRGQHMIRFSAFVAFLKAIGFKRIPRAAR